MSEIETQTPPPASPDSTPLPYSIWPPTQRTRDAVTTRLIETLTTPSVLSQRYGTLPQVEASLLAKSIEDEAFALASSSPGVKEAGDGFEILQLYSKEISKRTLHAVKSRSADDDVAKGTGDVANENVAVVKGSADVAKGMEAEQVVSSDNVAGEKEDKVVVSGGVAKGTDDVANVTDDTANGTDDVEKVMGAEKVVADDDVAGQKEDKVVVSGDVANVMGPEKVVGDDDVAGEKEEDKVVAAGDVAEET